VGDVSGETERQVSGWTTDTLNQYVKAMFIEHDLRYQQRFESQEQNLRTAITAQASAVQAALASSEKAVTKAETAAEKRFDSVNEFREQLADQAATFIARREYEVAHAAVVDKLNDMIIRFSALEGHSSGRVDVLGWVIAGASAIVAIVALLTR
jgi:Fe2+ transport system protein B